MEIGKQEETIVKQLYRYMSRVGIESDETKFFICTFFVNGIQHIAENDKRKCRLLRHKGKI